MSQRRLRFAILFIAASLMQQGCDGGTGPDGGTLGTSLSLTTTPSASAQSGVSFNRQPVIQVRDADGNAVTQEGTAITAAISAGGGGLSGQMTAATEADGSAGFTDLAITGGLGPRTLTFSAPGLTSVTATVILTDGLRFQQLLASDSYSCGRTNGGASYCWGANTNGILGTGSLGDRFLPGAVPGVEFQSLTGGTTHVCGVRGDGAALCWGSNFGGKLGDGTLFSRLTPVEVAGGLTFQSLSAGGSHTCGLTTAGAAYCWGRNDVGQLGDGTQTDRSIPAPVLGGRTFRSVTAGVQHSCGLATDNRAYCWGSNLRGVLGDGTNTDRLTAVAVLGGWTFETLQARHYNTCGVRFDGAAMCWGDNVFGQVGDFTRTHRSTPAEVTGGLTFQSITVGYGLTCGVTTSGAGYCWGWNSVGQGGNGTIQDGGQIADQSNFAPVPVVGGLTFQSISAGYSHACGITVSGNSYCWGFNGRGGLGDGTTTNRPSPVRVRSP